MLLHVSTLQKTCQACQRSLWQVSLRVVQIELLGCISRANNGPLPAGLHCCSLLAVAKVFMSLKAPLSLDQ